MTTVYDFKAKAIDGSEIPLQHFENKVLLIVNTASKCGFTYQYEGLEALHRKYGPDGFAVLGFPCNQFNNQEPGDETEIANFCKLTYDVDFPLFAKVDVNGDKAHPLFKWLKKAAPGLLGSESIKWNFTKFLVDKHGQVQERFASATKPEAISGQIEKLLKQA
jgi:glutathione peroxidase